MSLEGLGNKDWKNMEYPKDFINQIICGDCLEVMKYIPDKSIDLTITSPPYDNLRDYNGYNFDFCGVSKELFRITKSGGILVWIVSDETKQFNETLSSFKQAIYLSDECKFNLLDTMIYVKKSYAPAYPTMMRYAQTFEYMFVFSKGKPKTFNPIKIKKETSSIVDEKSSSFRQKDGSMVVTRLKAGNFYKNDCNVWVYDVGKNKDTKDVIANKHPARFPEALSRDHIYTWSNIGDLILDPMVGSGTVSKQAKLLYRNCIGIDISEEYCEIARKRLCQ